MGLQSIMSMVQVSGVNHKYALHLTASIPRKARPLGPSLQGGINDVTRLSGLGFLLNVLSRRRASIRLAELLTKCVRLSLSLS
jgi:hypothetical protein